MRDYTFGNFLRELRIRRGLSQFQLGALVGMTDKAVSKWENGISKPHSRILNRLSEVLGITADELLAAKYRSDEDEKEISAMRKKFKDEAYAKLREKYSFPPDLRVMNRFLSEFQYMNENDDWIGFMLMLSRIRSCADEKGEHIRINGILSGSSFLLFVLGVTEIDPLLPNYYCPDCRKIEFSDEVRCGWDLPPRKCSCGREFLRSGLNIPLVSAAGPYTGHPRIDIIVPEAFFDTAHGIIASELSDRKTVILVKNRARRSEQFVVLSGDTPDSGQVMSYEENHKKFGSFPAITISCDTELDSYRRLEEATNTSFSRIPFASAEIFDLFIRSNRDGIGEFRASFYSDMTEVSGPKNIFELIQLAGLSHGTGVWTDNAENLLREGKSLSEVIVYQEDIFEYIQSRMNACGMYETGWAECFMREVRKGKYTGHEMWNTHKKQLAAIGVESWFIESVTKIGYLFPRGFGALYVKYALILMWYKLNFPDVFSEIMLKDQ